MAVRFDADGEDYTRNIGSDGFNIQTNTVTCWLNIAVDRNTWSAFWSFDESNTSNFYYLETDESGTEVNFWSDHNATSTVQEIPLFVATVGTWYFVAVSRNGTGANATNFYWAAANATTLTTTSATINGTINETTFRVGESPFGGEWLNGSMAAIKIWDGVAMSQTEIENEWKQTAPHRTANLWGFYPFTNGGATTEARTDFSGNGRILSGGTNSVTADGPPIPWRMGRRRYIYIPASAQTHEAASALTTSTTLAANASLVTVASSALTTSVTVAANASLATKASSALTTSVTVAANASLVPDASSALTASVTVAANVSLATNASSALTTSVTVVTNTSLVKETSSALTTSVTVAAGVRVKHRFSVFGNEILCAA